MSRNNRSLSRARGYDASGFPSRGCAGGSPPPDPRSASLRHTLGVPRLGGRRRRARQADRCIRQSPRRRFRVGTSASGPRSANHDGPTRTFCLPVDKGLRRRSAHEPPGWAMCKLTKTDSAVLSIFLETQYVQEVMERGYAVPPNLDVPARPAPLTRSLRAARARVRLRRVRPPVAPSPWPCDGGSSLGPRAGSPSRGPSRLCAAALRPSPGPGVHVPGPAGATSGRRVAPPGAAEAGRCRRLAPCVAEPRAMAIRVVGVRDAQLTGREACTRLNRRAPANASAAAKAINAAPRKTTIQRSGQNSGRANIRGSKDARRNKGYERTRRNTPFSISSL